MSAITLEIYTFQVILRFTAMLLTNTIANVWIIIPTCLFVGALLFLRLYQMKTSREIKRLEAIGRLRHLLYAKNSNTSLLLF